jgi:hypothetical protein
MGPLAAPLITAGASLLGNLFNIGSQNRTNQRQQSVNEQMYNRQRADALADWNMQNAYNSPSQQMQRFKEAGLNPNLIYGQMTNSPVVRSTDQKAPDFVAPKIDTNIPGNPLSQYYDIQSRQLGLKQQEAAILLANEDIRNKRLKNDYDSSYTYNAEVGLTRHRNLLAQTEKTIADWTMTNQLMEMNPLKKQQIEQQTQNLINSMNLANLDYQQKAATNEVIRQAMRQAIKIQGNKYELDKLTNELENSLRRKALRNDPAQDDIIKNAKDILGQFYEPLTYTGQFIK